MDELEHLQGLLADGDVPGLVRCLRGAGERLPLGEVARLLAGAARLAGLDDLARAATAVAGARDAQGLYDLGYACTERGIPDLGVRPLALALDLAPGSAPVLSELVAALEQSGQHARAVELLEKHNPPEWELGFCYVYNAVMAGDLDKAAAALGRLPQPQDVRWKPAREKVRRMLARAGVARAVTPLDHWDLRGWHYVLTGGILASLSPWGFGAGMTGRWGCLFDSPRECAGALARLRLVLAAAGQVPESVALLPDRSSRILGTAAATLMGLPAADFDPGNPAPRTLVVAYDLTATDPAAVAALRQRAPGQVLVERATCWTDPPRATADVSGLLAQLTVPPWEPQPRFLTTDGTIGDGPADDRAAGEIAAEIASAEPGPDEGDEDGPPDTGEELRRFTEAVTAASAAERDGGWLGGIREYIPNAGPVPSSRFI